MKIKYDLFHPERYLEFEKKDKICKGDRYFFWNSEIDYPIKLNKENDKESIDEITRIGEEAYEERINEERINEDYIKDIWECYKRSSNSEAITYGNILNALQNKVQKKSKVSEKVDIWSNKYPLNMILDKIHTYGVLKRHIALIELEKQKKGNFFKYSDLKDYYRNLAEKKKRAIHWRGIYSQIWNKETLETSYNIKKRIYSQKDKCKSLQQYTDEEKQQNLSLNQEAKIMQELDEEIKQGKTENSKSNKRKSSNHYHEILMAIRTSVLT